MKSDKLGFLYPSVQKNECVDCGLCEKICTNINNHSDPQKTPSAFAAKCNDDAVIMSSSSGGIFESVSKYILSQGGAVFGAAFNDNYHSVEHIAVYSLKDLNKLKRSKYLQSNVESIYKEVKLLLKQGSMVLFSGTPCQTAALKTYLGTVPPNLYLQAVACHGVPAPKVWSEYLNFLEKNHKSKTKSVNFRDKHKSWRNYSLTVEFNNGKIYSSPYAKDNYMRGFINDVFLRDSCYSCSFKESKGYADIILADFWGAKDLFLDDDDKGLSLVITTSEKGEFLLEKISDMIDLQKVDYCEAIKANPSLENSATFTPKRKSFENDFETEKINVLLKKYCSIFIIKKIKRKLKKIWKIR